MLDRLTLRLAGAFVLAAVVFTAWPGIDLRVARLFHEDGAFLKADVLEVARHFIWAASILTLLGASGLWLAWRRLGAEAAVPGRLWGWVAALYLVGPGFLVNVILKEHWGRARPAQVLSGEAEFTTPLAMADECARNCSFPSGEAAAATALAIVLCTLLWPFLGVRGRRRAVAFLGTVAVAAALMRVATGRHFLSDAVFAALLTAFVALGLWRTLDVAPAWRALSLPALRADLHLVRGRALRRWRRLIA